MEHLSSAPCVYMSAPTRDLTSGTPEWFRYNGRPTVQQAAGATKHPPRCWWLGRTRWWGLTVSSVWLEDMSNSGSTTTYPKHRSRRMSHMRLVNCHALLGAPTSQRRDHQNGGHKEIAWAARLSDAVQANQNTGYVKINHGC